MTLWTPADYTSGILETWHDPSNAANLTLASGKVQQNNDLSGNGFHQTQAAGAFQPAYVTNALNGLAAEDFASSAYLDTSLGTSPALRTFIALAKWTGNNPGTLWGSTQPAGLQFRVYNGNPNFVSQNTANIGQGSGSTIGNGVWCIIVGTYNQSNGNYSFRVNGSAVGSGNNPQSLGSHAYYMGHQQYGEDWGGLIAERGTLYVDTLADIELFEGYLAGKWGIQSVLPSGHPYKTAAPTSGPASYTLSAAVGSFSLTGQTADLKRATRLSAASGSFVLNGQATALNITKKLNIGYGAFVLNGQSVALTKSRNFTAACGNYNLTGQSVGLQIVVPTRNLVRNDPFGYNMMGAMDEDQGNTLEISYGNFIITGQTAGLSTQRKLGVVSGSYTLAGQISAFKRSLRLLVSNGSFVIAGQQAKLNQRMKADSGSFTLTGIAAAIFKTKLFSAVTGLFGLAGQSAEFKKARALKASMGTFTLTGKAAAFLRNTRYISPDTGYFTIEGQAAQLGSPVPYAQVGNSKLPITSTSNVGRQLIAVVQNSIVSTSSSIPQVIGMGVDVPVLHANLSYDVPKKERTYDVYRKNRNYNVLKRDRERRAKGF